jgi:hypothetical protein
MEYNSAEEGLLEVELDVALYNLLSKLEVIRTISNFSLA